MNPIDIIIALVVATLLIFAIRSIIKNSKKGRCAGCVAGCNNTDSVCNQNHCKK